MTNTRLLDKIRALLRLSADKSTTEAEAHSAAAAAQRLIEEHRLDLGTLDTDEPATDSADEEIRADRQTPLDESRKKVVWRNRLATGIARANGCDLFIGARLAGMRSIFIVGRPSDVAVVRYLFAYLVRVIDQLGADAVRSRPNEPQPRSFGRAFRIGAATRVVERLNETIRNTRNAAQAQAYAKGGENALVRVNSALARQSEHSAAIQAFMRCIAGPPTTSTIRYLTNGYEAGRAAGDKIDIGTGSRLGAGAKGLLGK